MDVLIIGGAGNITNAIIEKLHKEGERIYVLTGSEVKLFTYKHVFEQYSFTYDNGSIKEIFESINPDVTIFMGAYDPNFNWANARGESVRYMAGLLNILMGYSMVKCGRFIYLSSELVYSFSYPVDIPEEEPAKGGDFRSMIISQGEDLCRTYQKIDGLDIVILRLDHLYGIPENKNEVSEICSWMCVQALREGVIPANARISFSMLYISDAVMFLYDLICAEKIEEPLYHLSSSREINQMELARLIQKEMGDSVSICDNTVGEQHRVVLSGKKFQEAFSEKIYHQPEDVVPLMVSYVKKHKNRFLSEEDRGKGFWGRFSQTAKGVVRALFPFFENLVFFIPFFMLNNRAVGSAYFNKLDFYLLYVLLFAIVYGQQQATFSAILATAGYIFRQMYNRTGFDVVLDYNTYVWIAQLFILGLVVGYLHDQLAIVRKEDKDEIHYLSGQVNDIQDINTSNVRIKNVMEEQIVNHNQSVGKIYEITSELDQYASEEVLFYAAEVIGRLMDTKDVAIYSVANGDYARLFSSTSEKARSLGNSICYSSMEEIYESVTAHKVYMNKTLQPEYPLMAEGIFEGDRMQLIVMVWGIPWERMNLGTTNLLTIIGYLIQNAVLRANRYEKALENERYRKGTKILEKEAFRSLVKAYLTAKEKGLTECALLSVSVTREEVESAGEKILGLLRRSDYLGELEQDKLYVLLSNTDREGAGIVTSRFREIGYDALYQEEFQII